MFWGHFLKSILTASTVLTWVICNASFTFTNIKNHKNLLSKMEVPQQVSLVCPKMTEQSVECGHHLEQTFLKLKYVCNIFRSNFVDSYSLSKLHKYSTCDLDE